ncbi:MAG: GNAT family N-acetyltransferase [Polyangiaceae bacterium]|jgi:GNAT superfamily N-acetyltransferase|nr:GNAT family N-acetyltransferase [Polyangiaceae bacterium]MBK8938357.1 GNAT family N-acetyltransferase [Polyangiaceae bacterium]
MQTRALEKADYDHIVRVIDHWWEGPTTALAHPMFFYELGRLARVVEWEDGQLVGFLFGFLADSFQNATRVAPPPGSRIGFVHLVGIHPDFRRRGVGAALYASFEEACREASCVGLKAITTHGDEGSVQFHAALGFTVTTVDDYAGPGRARIVFEKAL